MSYPYGIIHKLFLRSCLPLLPLDKVLAKETVIKEFSLDHNLHVIAIPRFLWVNRLTKTIKIIYVLYDCMIENKHDLVDHYSLFVRDKDK
jgi:hypothetical protein